MCDAAPCMLYAKVASTADNVMSADVHQLLHDASTKHQFKLVPCSGYALPCICLKGCLLCIESSVCVVQWLQADVSGTIVKWLVDNGASITPGQVHPHSIVL